MSEQKKRLRLTVEIDDIWADDLDESATIISGRLPEPKDRLQVVTEEWMRPEVILTITTYPGEKSQNDDFAVLAYPARIVEAEAVDV